MLSRKAAGQGFLFESNRGHFVKSGGDGGCFRNKHGHVIWWVYNLGGLNGPRILTCTQLHLTPQNMFHAERVAETAPHAGDQPTKDLILSNRIMARLTLSLPVHRGMNEQKHVEIPLSGGLAILCSKTACCRGKEGVGN